MIIALPNDNRGYLYHIVDLLGNTVHAYRHFDTAYLRQEGDQRICIQVESTGQWITDAPTPDPEMRRAELARADRLLSAAELEEKYATEMHNGEHPQYLRRDWRHEAAEGNTLRSYWQWVEAQLEGEE